MALFNEEKVPLDDVMQLREEGLTDSVIIDELTKRGYSIDQVNAALHQADRGSAPPTPETFPNSFPGSAADSGANAVTGSTDIYGRIEEIAESLVDEKWDELVVEVRKIIAWKEKIEENQSKMMHELNTLKEDFKTLHQGVLGRLETYDEQMREVGTELGAVGKVFKDVIPEFVENVKEMSRLKGKKK